jgi:hypothetical protein
VRRDLADIRLAEYVFAPHYAEPLPRVLLHDAALRASPAPDSVLLAELKAGESFELLDVMSGYGWGVATQERLVGYVDAEAIGPGAEA